MPSLRWSSCVLALALGFPSATLAAPAPAPSPPAEPPSAPMSEGPLSPLTPHDSCRKQPLSAKFRITLEKEAQLVDLVRWMSSITCTKFVWGAGVRDGKVTVVSPEPVSIQQAYAAFYAALETMGLTVEQSGDYLKIVESQDAARRVLPVYGPGQSAPARDRFVTQLYRPQPGRVGDVVAVVEHLKGDRGSVQAVGDLVIITDTGSRVARLVEVIEEVDRPLAGEADAIFLHPVEHADPEAIAAVVREVFLQDAASSTAGRSTPTRTAAAKAKTTPTPPAAASPASTALDPSSARITALSIDLRTGTLVITAPRDDYPTVRRFIDRLDVPAPDDGGTLFVLPLDHADPEEIAAVLGSLPTGRTPPAGGAAGGSAPPSASAGATAGASPRTGVSIGGEIHVTADPATRSLVVMASPHDFLALKRVVDALDVERRQVYIEAYILELSSRRVLDTGASGHVARANDNGGVDFLSSQTGGSNSAILDTSILSGLAAGALGAAVPGSDIFRIGEDIPAFGVVIQALETIDDVNLVADPHLYTADNKTAKMEVGQNIPIPTGTNSFNGVGGPQSQTVYQRQDVSLKLEVTPHIGKGDALTLDIAIENHEVASEGGEGGPTTTNRSIELEEVLVRDGQPVVLGGMVQEKEKMSTRQVPGLGSIPLLGWLFKGRVRTREKVNLLVVLIPHVLESPEDARKIHQRRIRERREFLERETAFERRDLQAHINYARKSGLLSAVEAEATDMRQQLDFQRQAQVQLRHELAEQIAPGGSYELTAAPAPTPAPPIVVPIVGDPAAP